MRIAKCSARARTNSAPEIKFEDQKLTSFGGLVVFQKLFADLGLLGRLRDYVPRSGSGGARFYPPASVVMCVVVHLLLGYRRLREMDCYRDDPLVLHVLGMARLPSVPTLSRMLGEFEADGVGGLRDLCRDLVLMRLKEERLPRVTLDFDGSVLSTGRRAQGAAVGFNKAKKGARSYYPLFCTVAQTGQVLDHHHRSGNVHDSNGAAEFVERCVEEVRCALPGVALEVRMDSAFFSDELVGTLETLKVEYTVSVPFERFAELKGKIEARKVWWPTFGAEGGSGHFEEQWKPKSWSKRARFVFLRTRSKVQDKEPVQLDLFRPTDSKFDFKVIITNKNR